MKTFNERVLEAKAIASLGKVMQRDTKSRVRSVVVPGSEATLNQVIIRRGKGVFTVECLKQQSHNGHTGCPGNYAGICRHSLAAIFISLQDAGYAPRFRKNRADIEAYARQHAQELMSDGYGPAIFKLVSHQKSSNVLWFVAEDLSYKELTD